MSRNSSSPRTGPVRCHSSATATVSSEAASMASRPSNQAQTKIPTPPVTITGIARRSPAPESAWLNSTRAATKTLTASSPNSGR